ncbi:MAG TPA: hypothetical protein VLG50_01750 [Candidatus Saccharimonadales bacterium]|nr:hypothetical protein [Candidatus Saccharimonadales bacterium]
MKNLLKKTMILSSLLMATQAQTAFSCNTGLNNVTGQNQATQAPKSRFVDILLRHCKDASISQWLSSCNAQTAEQILKQAIDENRLDIIKFVMPHASKEDRGVALLHALQANSMDIVTELLKHKIAEKALWKSLKEVGLSYLNPLVSINHQQFAGLILQHMKPLTLTESCAQELIHDSSALCLIASMQKPVNVHNMIVKMLVKNNKYYALESFLHKRSVYTLGSSIAEQQGISDRVIRKVAQYNTSPKIAVLLAEKFYQDKETLRKFDIAMLTTWSNDLKTDFYKHYDSVRSGATCSNSVVENITQTGHLVHNFLLRNAAVIRFMKQPATNSNNYEPQDLAYDLIKTNMINRVCQLEKEFDAQGYQTFYHGRRWEWNFANDMWRLLCALKNNTSKMSEIVALRYRTDKKNIQTLQEYRKDLITNGASNYNCTGTTSSGKDAEITCMNRTILTNSSNSGICTGYYFLDNYSIAVSGNTLHYVEQMFKDNNMHDLYKKFKPQIQQLAQQHHETSQRGELLCIAVRKNCLDQMVYHTNGYGCSKSNQLASQVIEDQNKKSIVHQTEIEDGNSFFCFAVSDIPGEFGDKYTIKSLHNADPVKYEAYQKQLESLFADMKKAK